MYICHVILIPHPVVIILHFDFRVLEIQMEESKEKGEKKMPKKKKMHHNGWSTEQKVLVNLINHELKAENPGLSMAVGVMIYEFSQISIQFMYLHLGKLSLINRGVSGKFYF